jgi:hypothetical protein
LAHSAAGQHCSLLEKNDECQPNDQTTTTRQTTFPHRIQSKQPSNMDILKKIPLMTTLHGAMTTDPAEDSVAGGFMSNLQDSWVEMWGTMFHVYAGTLVVVGTGTILGTSVEAGNVSQFMCIFLYFHFNGLSLPDTWLGISGVITHTMYANSF